MTITTRITLPEYRNLLLVLTYRKKIIIALTCVAMFMFVGSLLSLLHVYTVYEGEFTPYLPLTFSMYMLVGMPLIIQWTAGKSYKTNLRVQEQITYEFTADAMIQTGQTFNAELQWSTMNKIEETKHWFLIYNTPQMANCIPKAQLNEGQITELRNTLRNINASIPVKLMKG